MPSSSTRLKIQTSILIIGFGIFGVTYVLKDNILFNQILSYSGLFLAGAAYLYGLKQLNSNTSLSTAYLLLMALIIRIGAVPIPIFIDDLLYRGLWDGWLQSNSLNPYQYLPSSDQLELLKSNDLHDLIFRGHEFTSYSPLYEVFFRFTGWLYDRFGLAYTILIHKTLSIIIDLVAIYSLVILTEVTQKPKRYVAAFAWNPFLILFVTSQGLFVQLGALAIIWFFYLIHNKNYTSACLLWGLVMLATPAGWLGLPLIVFGLFKGRKRWLALPLSLFTFLVWWLPFLSLEAIQHYILGVITYWADGFSHLSAGYLILTLLPTESIYKSLLWLVVLMVIYAVIATYIGLKKSPLDDHQFSLYLFGFSLAFFLLSPVLLLSLVPVLFILSIYSGKYVAFTAVLTTLLLINFVF